MRQGSPIEYIVIHYVGAVSTARNNAIYFQEGYRAASAHYFVDEQPIIYQCVDDSLSAWSVGDKYNSRINNQNTLNIELCNCVNVFQKLDFYQRTIENAAFLTALKAVEYKIPLDRVIRHYDVTGKQCPAPFVQEPQRWNDFKGKVADAIMAMVYEEWQKDLQAKSVDELMEKGIINDSKWKTDYNPIPPWLFWHMLNTTYKNMCKG
jgi:N-acetylmuramoyl-L-alanine amidase CwlA